MNLAIFKQFKRIHEVMFVTMQSLNLHMLSTSLMLEMPLEVMSVFLQSAMKTSPAAC